MIPIVNGWAFSMLALCADAGEAARAIFACLIQTGLLPNMRKRRVASQFEFPLPSHASHGRGGRNAPIDRLVRAARAGFVLLLAADARKLVHRFLESARIDGIPPAEVRYYMPVR